MSKLIAVLGVVAVVVAVLFVLFSRDGRLEPIVDEACEPGYSRVGEGCMPQNEACELAGEEYYYDAIANECRTR